MKKIINENVIFIISPPRSGSKLLRDTLASSDKIDCIEYDINFIWTRKQSCPDDVLNSQSIFDPYIKQFILKHKKNKSDFIIDKTVSNCLRLGFIEKNFKGCKYIFLHRNENDTINSLKKCWRLPGFSEENQSRAVFFNKILKFPYRHCWKYGITYVKNLFIKLVSKESLSSTWGPRFIGVDEYLLHNGIDKTCEKQYQECVDAIASFKCNVDNNRYVTVSYDDLIRKPYDELGRVSSFLNQNNALISWKGFVDEKYRL